jgi:hypothetical protein
VLVAAQISHFILKREKSLALIATAEVWVWHCAVSSLTLEASFARYFMFDDQERQRPDERDAAQPLA